MCCLFTGILFCCMKVVALVALLLGKYPSGMIFWLQAALEVVLLHAPGVSLLVYSIEVLLLPTPRARIEILLTLPLGHVAEFIATLK